jgi:uncharacterized protein with HEPN domain
MSSESKSTPHEVIQHARRRIAQIGAWTSEDDEASYLANDERQAAVERNFIAIGEAIKDLARAIDLGSLDPDGPWRHPARFRDFLAHKYDEGISHPEVWSTIKNDLPVLDAALARLQARIGD